MHRLIAMDVETYGNYLTDPDARILCCGAHGEGIHKVFDFDKESDKQECFDLITNPDIDIIWHNCLFDNGWFHDKYNVVPKGIIHDTMTRAALIDERQSMGLDDNCKRMGVQGKNKAETIEEWFDKWQTVMKGCAKGLKKGLITDDNQVLNTEDNETYKLSDTELECLISGKWKSSVWDNALLLWTESKDFKEQMMKYNLQDCVATYNLFWAQEKFMPPVQHVYELECKLIPILLKMKKTGIRFDQNHASELIEKVSAKEAEVEKKLWDMYGISGEMINSSKQLGARMNEMGIQSPVKTKTGAQSWAEGALVRIHHPVTPLIFEYKNYHAILSKFLLGSLSKSVVNGRIHCTFLPMLREEGGTVTGRFSCREPNLQQIPARDKGHGEDFSQDMRSLFLPEEGQMIAAMDYSQIEAVLLAHFAKGPQAEWFREQMRAGADLHNIVMGMTGITYRPVVKTFNYGCIYGMGWQTAMEKNYTLFEKFAKEKHESIEQFTKDIYHTYHNKFPVVKDTMNWAQDQARMYGYIDTMGGRRQHKPKAAFDPQTGKINDFLYKMLNKLIQGTAADILKQALITASEAGIYDVLTLHLLVHDEQVNSVPFTKEGTEAAVELQHIMGNVYKDQLLVPIKAECELGPNWGYWSDRIYKDMQNGIFNPEEFKADYRETH
jgi:DNA polymerase I-like protein with 3'-5' exonuclease and polymerase domains